MSGGAPDRTPSEEERLRNTQNSPPAQDQNAQNTQSTQTPSQTPDQTPGQTAGQAPPQTPGQTPSEQSGQLPSREPGLRPSQQPALTPIGESTDALSVDPSIDTTQSIDQPPGMPPVPPSTPSIQSDESTESVDRPLELIQLPVPELPPGAAFAGMQPQLPPGAPRRPSAYYQERRTSEAPEKKPRYLHNAFKYPGHDFFAGLDFLEHGVDFERAIAATGFGRFHFCLLAVTGLIYANTAIGITIVSFVLPTATCDFRMTSADKGWLTAAPMLGMVLGSYFWGCLADTKGRKVVLVSTLLLDGIVGIISSFVQILPVFMACRFINGFSVAGAMGICFPYLGEFQQTKYREKILCWMEMFWTLGVILLPLIAWAIIPITGIRIERGSFSYDSWNWFVAACGVPSILLGCWLFYFPESPKFMMECGDYDDALQCLKTVYKINTGDDPDNYPIKSLKEKQRTASVGSQTSVRSIRSLSMRRPKDLKILFSEIWAQTKALCKPPYLKYTILTCLIQFGLTTSYYTLMIWFPELFNRYEEFEKRFPNTSASVCDVSAIVVVDEMDGDPFDCDKTIDSSVYMHTLIVGLACIPTSLWLPLCVHKLGAKFFLIFSLGVAGLVTIGLYFVQNSTQNLVLSCIFEALTSLAISLVFCVLVDLFPTNLRVMAAALSLTAGRGGGLLGNVSFGYLIDINCVIPIVVFSAFLFLAAILCFFLPKTGQEALD